MNPTASKVNETKLLLLSMVAEAKELDQAAGGSVADAVAGWLAPQFLLAARKKLEATDEIARFELLRMFVQDWALLRRGDHSAARLQLEREALELQRSNCQAQKEKEFWEWLERPEIREKIFPNPKRGLTKETLEKIERELHLL
jgi:hypothetical protein